MSRHLQIGLLSLFLIPYSLRIGAQTPLVTRPNSEKTLIAPAYFGSNAFPIPDMLDGRAQGALRVDIAGDGYWGDRGDKTADVFARIHIPIFTDRVNLTVWYPIYEWYSVTDQWLQHNRVEPESLYHSGSGAGDIYVSTDIWILKARKWVPDVAIRAALKTASGGQYEKARHYDAPGYWFDLSAGKSLYFKKGAQFPFAQADEEAVELRLSGTIGFLCWQTDNGRQNDALYYGLQMLLKYRYLSAQVTWSGYRGWEYAGDEPMSIKVRLAGHIKGFEPYVGYQKGLKDFPYQQLRVGLVYNWSFIKPSKIKEWHRKDGTIIDF